MKVINHQQAEQTMESHSSHGEGKFYDWAKEKRLAKLKEAGRSCSTRGLRRTKSNTIGADQVKKCQNKRDKLRRSKSLVLPEKGQRLTLHMKKLEAANEEDLGDYFDWSLQRKDLKKTKSESSLNVNSTAAA